MQLQDKRKISSLCLFIVGLIVAFGATVISPLSGLSSDVESVHPQELGAQTFATSIDQFGQWEWVGSRANASPLTQERSPMKDWSFAVNGYSVYHGKTVNTLNIAIRYTLKDEAADTDISNPDPSNFTSLLNQVTEFLTHYPNEDDYWEVINRNLTEATLRKNPSLSSLTIKLEVLPGANFPYTRATTVTYTAEGQCSEAWSFFSTDNPVDHQGRQAVNIYAEYTYKPGLHRSQYPDFEPIQTDVADLLIHYPDPFDSWETVNRQLAEAILAEYPTIANLRLSLQALPTQELPYAYSTSVMLTQS